MNYYEEKLLELNTQEYKEKIISGKINFEEFVNYLGNVNALARNMELGQEGTGIYGKRMLASDLLSPNNDIQMRILRKYYEALKVAKEDKSRALISYYILNDLHLFEDGNGRTSRFMYQLFDGKFDINCVIHDDNDMSISRGDIENENEDIDTINNKAMKIVLNKLINNGEIGYDDRLLQFDQIQTFGTGFVGDYNAEPEISDEVKVKLGDEQIKRFYECLQNNNSTITVSGIAMCKFLSRYGLLQKSLEHNEEKEAMVEHKKLGISDKRLIFRIVSNETKKADIDFSTWTVEMCKEFCEMAEKSHEMQLETIIEMLLEERKQNKDEINREKDGEYQITSSDIAVATKSKTKSNIIEKVKHLFSKIKEQISNIGDR